ncbi:MAG: YIP1 family protein [Spirochaetaceae bacterium]|nr:YIP1 family protein [Spirochaetaceae bacterium]
MKNVFVLWKDIIVNPFEGYKGVNESTKILLPLLSIIVLFLISISMIVPIMLSDAYGDAVVRVQISTMAERGNEMSAEQQAAVAEQIKSPMVRNITIVSAYAGGLITFFLVTLLVTLILKIVISSVKKETVNFSLVFKIIIFASIVAMIQSILKMGITLSGDWERTLSRVNDTAALQQALQSPVSLAALADPGAVSNSVYMLIDSFSDIFNWIYYIFLYAGLRVVTQLEKKPALIIIIALALFSIAIGLLFTLFT